MRRATVKRLGEKFASLRDITRPAVRRWVTELVEELKPATVARMTSDCRSYWAYLATIEAVPEDAGTAIDPEACRTIGQLIGALC